jgi:hypothetical protein
LSIIGGSKAEGRAGTNIWLGVVLFIDVSSRSIQLRTIIVPRFSNRRLSKASVLNIKHRCGGQESASKAGGWLLAGQGGHCPLGLARCSKAAFGWSIKVGVGSLPTGSRRGTCALRLKCSGVVIYSFTYARDHAWDVRSRVEQMESAHSSRGMFL